jgi:hypothetical protein
MSRTSLLSALVFGISCSAMAQQPAPPARAANRGAVTAPLFFKEEWQRPNNKDGQVPVLPDNLTNPNLELKVYGPAAKNLVISGTGGSETAPGEHQPSPFNLWTGMVTAPIMATLRDRNNYVDLTGLAKVRWVTRTSGFHVVRPVVKLADGTFLVGEHTDSSTTTFLESEFAFTGMRWIKLDPERIVTTGVFGPVGEASLWVDNPDLSKVDEVGFADLMPGTGRGPGGWINVGRIEVYGRPVKR